MRKRSLSILAVFGILVASLGLSVGVHAVTTPALTEVTGVITDNNLDPVPGANVTVTCNGHMASDTTDAAGSYRVSFPAGDCPFGTTVKVMAQKGGMSGMASDTVRGITTKLNLAIVNVSIPEYGLIGMISAAGVGLGLIAYTRHRQKLVSQQF